jgi:hypothetical protein
MQEGIASLRLHAENPMYRFQKSSHQDYLNTPYPRPPKKSTHDCLDGVQRTSVWKKLAEPVQRHHQQPTTNQSPIFIQPSQPHKLQSTDHHPRPPPLSHCPPTSLHLIHPRLRPPRLSIHPYSLPATTHTMPSHPSLHLRQFTAIPSHASGISPARPTTNRPNSQSRPHDTCLPHTGAQGWRSQYLSVLVQVHLQRLHVVFEP